MKRYISCLLVLLLLCGCAAETQEHANASAKSSTPAAPETGKYIARTDAYSGMDDPDFWAAQCEKPDEVRMTSEQIAAFNAAAVENPETLCVDLDKYPEKVGRTVLEHAIQTYGLSPDSTFYTGKSLITGIQQAAINKNLNLAAVLDENAVRWGFIVRNCALKTFPSTLPLYTEPDDVEYDQTRETTLHTWERVAVLHISADGKWMLVQAYNYLGWAAVSDVALTDRASWMKLSSEDFVMVRGARVALGGSAHSAEINGTVLTMGTRLPLAEQAKIDNAGVTNAYAVLLPVRGAGGALKTVPVRIPHSEDVCLGYAPLTDRELLRQVFRLLGQRYGWGGMFGGWDCSSICADAYAVFGVMLPRNSNRQTLVGTPYDVSGYPDGQKLEQLSKLRPGALVELQGHMMFWLGTVDGKGYVIHSTYGFQAPKQGFYIANSVVVSSLDVQRKNGMSILANVRAVAAVENPKKT